MQPVFRDGRPDLGQLDDLVAHSLAHLEPRFGDFDGAVSWGGETFNSQTGANAFGGSELGFVTRYAR